ncbi:hypothetical protein LOTGIDRAFT_236192 [Lottia gigantea]|uniref:CX domain-containing protein n=1 Tax=Lottia gigantea TaxID=225164 RepID=V3ZKB0_LOTGI|nr:hypothetical protein LOTGIDRAFT_236192 [Lottia gigantea]ESO84702.1 hypothetical protein LOTGIDRAFT_236192 [Lottia gigantea]
MTYFLLFICCFSLQVLDVYSEENKCFRNEIFGDRDGNVYYCPNPENEYTECCEKDQEFTCCQKNSEKNLGEQLMLWGTIAAVVLLMIIIGVCVKKDINCCKSDRWIFYKFTSKSKKEQSKPIVGIEDVDQYERKDQQGYAPNYKHNSGFVYDGEMSDKH